MARTFSILGCFGLVSLLCWGAESPSIREVKPRVIVSNRLAAAVLSVKISSDGKMVAAGGESTSLNVWDAHSGKEITDFGESDDKRFWNYSVDFAPDGKILAVGTDKGGIQFWEVKTHKVVATLNCQPQPVYSIAFSPDGKTLAAGTDCITLWDVATEFDRAKWKGHEEGVSCVAFSPDGKTLASGGRDNQVCVWDPTTGKRRHAFQGHQNTVNSLLFTRDNQILASGSLDGSIKLWDLKTGKELHTFKGEHCAFTADSKHLIVDQSCKLTVWDVTTGAKQTEIKTTSFSAHAMIVSGDGKTLAVGCDRGRVLLWEVTKLLEGS